MVNLPLHLARYVLLVTVNALLLSCGVNSDPSVAPKDSAAGTAVILAAGDIANCQSTPAAASGAAKTAALIGKLDPSSRILTLGDNAYLRGTAEEFATCYEPTWGAFKDRTIAVAGNHDYGTADASAYFDYFGQAAGPDRTGYHSTKLAGWLIVALNSNIDASASSPQMRWFEAELAGHSGCTLVAWHHPLATSSTRGGTAVMRDAWSIAQRYKVDMILQGHEHQFERFEPLTADGMPDAANGVRSFVVGTGGAPPYDFGAIVAGSAARSTSLGVLELKIEPGRYQWAFRSVDSDIALDIGAAECRVLAR